MACRRPSRATTPICCTFLRSLKPNGQGACILPHGVLFRGNAEAAIRRNLIQRGVIKGIIGLPANLFYGTGIPACIVVLDKSGTASRKGIFVMDASKGFRKDGPKNRLREQDIHKIVDIFTRQVELPGYSRLVPVTEIADARNDYNLNLPRYIDTTEPEDIQDIGGHLQGGIPERDIAALERYWAVIPGVRAALFEADRSGYVRLRVPMAEIKATIFGHPEFTAFTTTVMQSFATWQAATAPFLKAFGKDGHPKALIETTAESLLEAFRAAPLLGAYDVYQHLMDYAAETLQDDAWRIADEGWVEAARARLIIEDKTKKTKARPDFVIGRKKYQAELIPPALLIARYFAAEQAAIEALETSLAALEQQIEEMAEEHGGEGGLLEDARNDKDKLTKASIAARLKEIRTDRDAEDERKALQDYLALAEQEAETAAKLKAAQDALMEKVLAKYGKLTEDEVKALVVDDKWLAAMESAVVGELERVSRNLTARLGELSTRYGEPLPGALSNVEALAARVARHLAVMIAP
jgi:type I restriction enzyme M protein